jgi:hypothetical protein
LVLKAKNTQHLLQNPAYFTDSRLAIYLNATIQDTQVVESADATLISKEAQHQLGFHLRLTPNKRQVIDINNSPPFILL